MISVEPVPAGRPVILGMDKGPELEQFSPGMFGVLSLGSTSHTKNLGRKGKNLSGDSRQKTL